MNRRLERLRQKRDELHQRVKDAAQAARAAEKKREMRREARLGSLLTAMMTSDPALCLRAEVFAKAFFIRQRDIDDFELREAASWFANLRAAPVDAAEMTSASRPSKDERNAVSVEMGIPLPSSLAGPGRSTPDVPGVQTLPPTPSAPSTHTQTVQVNAVYSASKSSTAAGDPSQPLAVAAPASSLSIKSQRMPADGARSG